MDERLTGHFLLVEDDAVIRRAVGRGARGLMDVRYAASGHDALQALRDDTLPRFVLLDFMLPDLNGLEVLRRLRADQRCGDVPVVMFSSLVDQARIQQTLEAGADAWVPKPDDPGRLRDLVRSLCLQWGGGEPASDAPARAAAQSWPRLAPHEGGPAPPVAATADVARALATDAAATPGPQRLRLLWKGEVVALVERCGPLARDTESVDTAAAGQLGIARRRPGATRFLPLEVAGATLQPSFDAWACQVGEPERRDLVLQVLRGDDAVTRSFRLVQCWVSAYEVEPGHGPGVRARRLRLEHEGWATLPDAGANGASGQLPR